MEDCTLPRIPFYHTDPRKMVELPSQSGCKSMWKTKYRRHEKKIENEIEDDCEDFFMVSSSGLTPSV